MANAPIAVPTPAVASAPVLQWVSTRSPEASRSAPRSAMRWHSARSSSNSALARSARALAPWAKQASMASRQYIRFTAVGRVARKRSLTACHSDSGWRAAYWARTKAALKPISGAPRMARCLTACCHASGESQRTHSSAWGSRVWSRYSSASAYTRKLRDCKLTMRDSLGIGRAEQRHGLSGAKLII